MSRRGCCALALLTLLIVPGCGGDSDGAGGTARDPFTEVSRQPTLTKTARRAGPRWERLTRIEGSGPATHAVLIAKGAIQWRARWRCTRGRLALAVTPRPRSPAAHAGGRCPGAGVATWVQTGAQRLRVDAGAGAGWSVVVEQQVDTPIDEPPLAAMTAPGARVIARGVFAPVEREGSGRATLYRLAGGRAALRLAPFRTSANTDLFVWLSSARSPTTTRRVVAARRIGQLIALKSTIGPQNYLLPARVDPRRIRSVAIWCSPVQIIYTAAAFRR